MLQGIRNKRNSPNASRHMSFFGSSDTGREAAARQHKRKPSAPSLNQTFHAHSPIPMPFHKSASMSVMNEGIPIPVGTPTPPARSSSLGVLDTKLRASVVMEGARPSFEPNKTSQDVTPKLNNASPLATSHPRGSSSNRLARSRSIGPSTLASTPSVPARVVPMNHISPATSSTTVGPRSQSYYRNRAPSTQMIRPLHPPLNAPILQQQPPTITRKPIVVPQPRYVPILHPQMPLDITDGLTDEQRQELAIVQPQLIPRHNSIQKRTSSEMLLTSKPGGEVLDKPPILSTPCLSMPCGRPTSFRPLGKLRPHHVTQASFDPIAASRSLFLHQMRFPDY